jgi:4-hydroxyphenylpyruvate dioxygenase
MDYLSYSRHHRNFPLQGSFPLIDFTKALVTAGYKGPLSLEIFNDEFRAAPSKRIAADGLRSLLFLQAEVYGGDILPPIPQVERIEFVEFTVDEGKVRALESFFKDLGLRKVAKHRSKDVILYRQGKGSFTDIGNVR